MLRVAEQFEATNVGMQRRANEDNLFVASPLFVVADGMGGARAGEVASQTAVEAFQDGLPADGSPEEQLAHVIRGANERIHAMAQSDDQLAGMGTTVTAAVVGEHDVAIAHVGDSRAYVWRRGELIPLTRDHSLVEELVRRGKLTEQQAAEHPQRSIITRALGPEAAVEVDTMSHRARNGDVFLLCSDGLTSMIDDASVAAILRDAPTLEEAGNRLIKAANDAGGRDNITVVLFRVESDDDTPEDEQPTGAGALHADDVKAAAGEPTKVGDAPATRVSPTPRRTAPPPAPAPAARRGPSRWRLRLRALIVLLVVLVLLAGLVIGGVLFARSYYFIARGDDGRTVINRGLNASPLGIDLFSRYCTSPMPYADGVRQRRGIANDEERSKDDAVDLVQDAWVEWEYANRLEAYNRQVAARRAADRRREGERRGGRRGSPSGGQSAPLPPRPTIAQVRREAPQKACPTG